MEPIVARLKIIAVESISQGYEQLSTDSYSNSFVDDDIRVLLMGSFSGRADSHPVFYEFSSSSDNSDLGRLFITNLGNGYAEVMVPVPFELSNININLRVKDLLKPLLVSQVTTATLQIEKVLSLPPVADAGEYSEFLLQPNQQNITVQLDGRGSFSPVGNPITFFWNMNNNVFGDSNTSVDTISAVTLEEGEHEFLADCYGCNYWRI